MEEINKKLQEAAMCLKEVVDWYEKSAGEFILNEKEIEVDKHLLGEALVDISLVGIGICLHRGIRDLEQQLTEIRKT